MERISFPCIASLSPDIRCRDSQHINLLNIDTPIQFVRLNHLMSQLAATTTTTTAASIRLIEESKNSTLFALSFFVANIERANICVSDLHATGISNCLILNVHLWTFSPFRSFRKANTSIQVVQSNTSTTTTTTTMERRRYERHRFAPVYVITSLSRWFFFLEDHTRIPR